MSRNRHHHLTLTRQIKDEFSNNDVEKKNLAWVVSGMHDGGEGRSVPERRTLDETIVVDLLVTRAGMLPILQASVDGNETLTTMSIRVVDISEHTGQVRNIPPPQLTSLCMAEARNWRGRITCVKMSYFSWDFCFNFPKSVGQHTESAELHDLWTESSLYAATTNETTFGD